MSVDVVLVTGRDMPIEDAEGPLIIDRLQARGVAAQIRTWGGADWDSESPDAGLVVIRSTWDYFDRRDRFLDWLRAVDRTSRVVNPPEVIEWNSHKQYLLELAAAGVPVVPTQVIRAGASTPEQLVVTTTDVVDGVVS